MMCKEIRLKEIVVTVAVVFALSQLQFNVFAQNDLPVLEVNTPVEETIEFGKSQSFRIDLNKNQYARIVSRQTGINTFLKVYDPNGAIYLEEKNFIENWKDNRALIVAETAGSYRIEIISLGRPEQSGKFKLILEEIRDATPPDSFLKKAQQTLVEAEKLHATGGPKSRNEALAKYEESLREWQRSGDFLGQADAYSYTGVILFSMGRLPEALAKTKEARSFYNKAGDKASEATAFRGIGLAYHMTGELDKALDYYEKGLEINQRLKNYFGEANDLGNIGGVYQYRGQYQKALDHYRQALALAKRLSNKQNEARLLNNIGEVYRQLNENEKALEYLKESLKLRGEVKDRRGEGNTQNNIGLAFLALENYQKAIGHFDLSLKIRRETGDIRGEGVSLTNIGFIKFKIGDYQNALDLLKQAVVIRTKINDIRGAAATSYILGQVNRKLNKIDEAIVNYQKAVTFSQRSEYRNTESSALKALAEIELEKGNLDKADELMKRAITIIESLRAGISTQSLRTTFLASTQSFYKSYIDLLMKKHEVHPAQRFDIEALQINEKTRARSLVELLSESKIEITKGIDTALVNRRNEIQIQINTKERQRVRLVGRKGAEKNLAAIEKDLSKWLEKYEEVKTQIRTKNPEYAELIEPKSLGIKEMQNLLDAESVLLEYSFGEKQSYVWVIEKNSVKSYVLPKRETLNEASKNLYDLMTNRLTINDEKAVLQASIELSDLVIKPFAKDLTKKRIIVVADEALQYVPFSVLTSKNSKPKLSEYRPLILKHEIISLPSLSVLNVLRTKDSARKINSNSIAVIADPVFSKSDPRVAPSIAQLKNKPLTQNIKLSNKPDDSLLGTLQRSADDLSINEFRRLRFSRLEANAIASFVPAGEQLKAVDFAADRDLLMKGDLSRYRILHFATHGLLNNKNPELSGIVLSLVDERGIAKDGFLRLHEIYNMDMNADLVVLSACQTALGKDVRGEGLIGLTRGFMYAGAESVVASLWKVEDRATAELMKKFYRAMLKDGQKPATALRTAQIEMLKDKRWNNPYYWAAFTLQGEWQ